MKSKEYRHGLVSAQIEIDLPLQIRALRKQHVGTQPDMAKLTGMKQPRISAMEKPGEVHFTLETLRRLAEAFDVALIVRFAPFSELRNWSGKFNPDTFQVPAFDEEVHLEERAKEQQKSAGSGASGIQIFAGLGTPEERISFFRSIREGMDKIVQTPYFRNGPMTLQELASELSKPAIQKQDTIDFKGTVIDIATRKPMGASTATEWVQSNLVHTGTGAH